MLYRGYIKTKDKKANQKFTGDAPLLTLKQAQKLDEYAGVLERGIVLIDIDNLEQSELLMDIVENLQLDCKVIDTTRGKHFLFRDTEGRIEKCGTNLKLACGLTADVKTGNRNSYELLKFDGEERFCEWDADEYQEVPNFLLPVKTNIDLFDLKEGEGRNSTLYKYILTLNSMGLSKDETREILTIINTYIFDEPLSDDELETVTRDEAFPKDTFYDGRVFSHEKFARFLLANDHIKRINGQLHIYVDGCYETGHNRLESAMIKYLPNLKAAHRTEVLKYLELICPESEKTSSADLICFKNGIYHISTGELTELTPDVVVTNKIPWNYEPSAYSELADKTLNKLACGDLEIRALLEECIGYCFYRRNELSKAFMLTGERSNGKSTFLDMVKNVLGQENYSALDLSELDERFSVATMSGKLANIGDDISDEFLSGRSVSLFKKIVSGNQVKAEYKGQDAFFFNPYVKLLFSANDIPRIRDKTGAVLRRLVIVPFRAKFSKSDPDFDPYITHKLQAREVMEYLITLGIHGLHRILENNGFTECELVTQELKDYELTNNPLLMFLKETGEAEILNHSTAEVYRLYRLFCSENGFNEITRANFTKEVNQRLKCETKNARISGKVVKIFRR